MIDRPLAFSRGAFRSERLDNLMTFGRFALVGLLSALVYAAVAACAAYLDFAGPMAANVIGYAAAIPINFALHRGFTFRSQGRVNRELRRYLVAHLTNVGVSTLTVYLFTEVAGWPRLASIPVVVVMIPVIQFFVLDRFVFRKTNECAWTI